MILEGKSIETKKTEEAVPSFFDIFVDEETSTEEEGTDIVPQADFIRDDLMCNSMEYFLDIYESEDYSASGESAEEDDEGDNKKKKGDEKKVINTSKYFLLILFFLCFFLFTFLNSLE